MENKYESDLQKQLIELKTIKEITIKKNADPDILRMCEFIIENKFYSKYKKLVEKELKKYFIKYHYEFKNKINFRLNDSLLDKKYIHNHNFLIKDFYISKKPKLVNLISNGNCVFEATNKDFISTIINEKTLYKISPWDFYIHPYYNRLIGYLELEINFDKNDKGDFFITIEYLVENNRFFLHPHISHIEKNIETPINSLEGFHKNLRIPYFDENGGANFIIVKDGKLFRDYHSFEKKDYFRKFGNINYY
jgi:hypothetical protein